MSVHVIIFTNVLKNIFYGKHFVKIYIFLIIMKDYAKQFKKKKKQR